MKKILKSTIFLMGVAFLLGNCGKKKQTILIDGSSTVYPISQAMAEEFMAKNPSFNVTVGISGTGGGFKKFCVGETDISDASREVKPSEMEKCKKNGIEFIELPVAYDGLSVVVSKKNDFVKTLTVEKLKKIFNQKEPAKTWKEVDPSWPDKEIKVYAPGQDSGTYDYFVEVILGKKERVRADASFSEDDNVLVKGVSEDPYAIAFFGLAYYEENKDKLKAIPIVNPATGKAIEPNLETVMTQTYVPLSRPLFIYVNKASIKKPGVKQFVNFYLDHAFELTKQVGYIPFPREDYDILKKYFAAEKTGSPKNEKHAGEFFSIRDLYSIEN